MWLSTHNNTLYIRVSLAEIYEYICVQKVHLLTPYSLLCPITQLSNLWWIPNSVSKGFDTAIKQAHQDDSNDTPQPICECQVGFALL